MQELLSEAHIHGNENILRFVHDSSSLLRTKRQTRLRTLHSLSTHDLVYVSALTVEFYTLPAGLSSVTFPVNHIVCFHPSCPVTVVSMRFIKSSTHLIT